MDGYALTAIIVLTLGAVAVSFLFSLRRVSSDALEQGRRAVTKPVESAEAVATKAVDTAGDVATRAIDAIESTAEPLSQSVASVCFAIASRIERRRDELRELREKVASLSAENESLRGRRVSVDEIQPILKVAFSQIDVSETLFVRRPVKETLGKLKSRDEMIEYLGAYRATNRQTLGVDLTLLKFRLVSPSVIEVGGLGRTEVIGNQPKLERLYTELRLHKTGGMLPESHEILKGDSEKLLRDAEDAHREELQASVTKVKALVQVERTLEQAALQFLRGYFQPRGFSIVKAETDVTEGYSLMQLTSSLNDKLDEERVKKSRALADSIQARDTLERTIAEDIEQLKNLSKGAAGLAS